MNAYLHLFIAVGGTIKMGEFPIQESCEKIFMQKALFGAKIDLFRERVSELERRWEVSS